MPYWQQIYHPQRKTKMNINNEAFMKMAQANAELSSRITELAEEIDTLTNRLDEIASKKENEKAGRVLESEISHYKPKSLDLPIERILDLHSDTPQVLDCLSVRADVKSTNRQITIERSITGSFWILEPNTGSDCIMLPRPNLITKAIQRSSINETYDIEGDSANDTTDTYIVVKPTILTTIRRNHKWMVKAKGLIRLGENPNNIRWLELITKINIQYEQIANAINTKSQDTLLAEVNSIRRINLLNQRYGEVVNVFINTCMPMAYALYFDKKQKQMIACPCIVQTGERHYIFPGWDEGIEIGQTPFGLLHGTDEISFHKTPKSHQILPQVDYLADKSKQNWAIAKSYQDASEMLGKIQNNWGNL